MPINPLAIEAASQRICTANHAFNALLCMLSPQGQPINQEAMYCLLQPIAADVEAAWDELSTMR